MNKFKERLRELRQEKGLTQQEISNALQIPPTTYANWEQGRREPSIDNIIALCKFFDIPAGYLLGTED